MLAKYQTWIAIKGQRTLGRINAQIDDLQIERYSDATEIFGSLEAKIS